MAAYAFTRPRDWDSGRAGQGDKAGSPRSTPSPHRQRAHEPALSPKSIQTAIQMVGPSRSPLEDLAVVAGRSNNLGSPIVRKPERLGRCEVAPEQLLGPHVFAL